MAHRTSEEREKSANETNSTAEDSESRQRQERNNKPPVKQPDLFLRYFSKLRDD